MEKNKMKEKNHRCAKQIKNKYCIQWLVFGNMFVFIHKIFQLEMYINCTNMLYIVLVTDAKQVVIYKPRVLRCKKGFNYVVIYTHLQPLNTHDLHLTGY